MSWKAVEVEGRKMWESPDGQRVYDPTEIGRIEQKAEPIPRPLNLYIGNGTLFFYGFLLGAFCGWIACLAVALNR